MSYYGGTVTDDGRKLIAGLMAGNTIEFTRVLVGSGSIPDGTNPIDMKELVEPIAEAVSTVPVVNDGVISMVVEYRNDLNGGLENGFWLREFGVFARTKNTEEVLLYYATLGDSPQPVNAFKDNRVDIRRYPITIALELDADIKVAYNLGAFITSEDAQDLISHMVNEKVDSLAIPSVTQMDITIPTSGWIADTDAGGAYALSVDIAADGITEDLIPMLTILPGNTQVVKNCEMSTTVRTIDGALRVYAQTIPEAEIQCSLALIDCGKPSEN